VTVAEEAVVVVVVFGLLVDLGEGDGCIGARGCSVLRDVILQFFHASLHP